MFILSGDFEQLEPVKDRANYNYKNSLALFELVDGNRLQLTLCRRSNDELFNMLLPENINKIKKSDFEHVHHELNLSFTNKKRIQINELHMNKFVSRKKKAGLTLEKLSYDPNSQNVKLLAGMPIIARKNSKALNIFNNETFTIKEIRKTENIMIIVDEDRKQEIPIDQSKIILCCILYNNS